MKTLSIAAAALTLASAAGSLAATANFLFESRKTTPEEVAHGAPAGGDVWKFFVTTDADILSVNQVLISSTAPLYQEAPPFGSNVEPAPPEFVALLPSLSADSWISTPGPTQLLGPDMPGDGALSLWGDLTNDGPQNQFQFAQLTFVAPTFFEFAFRLVVAGTNGPESFPQYFEYVPEPSAYHLAMPAILGLIACRRSRQAPCL